MPRLHNLGSLCIDRVYRVPKIAGSGETVASLDFSIYPGGKGANQSLAASKAGAKVSHFGCVGQDGLWLKDVLANGGVDASGVVEIEGDTGHAVIQVDDAGQNSIVIVGGTNRSISQEDMEAVVTGMESDDWLLLQNEINDLEVILELAAKHDRHVAFNVAPVDGREQAYDLSGVEVLIVNEVEAEALSHLTHADDVLDNLCTRFPSTHVVLTLGSEGLRYGFGSERMSLLAITVDAVDETAAGDAFIGFFMASLLRGETTHDALRLGSMAGAYAVTKAGAGVSIPTVEELDSFISAIED